MKFYIAINILVFILFPNLNPEISYSETSDSVKKVQVPAEDKILSSIIQLDTDLISNDKQDKSDLVSILKNFDFEKVGWAFAILLVGFFLLKLLTKILQFLSGKSVRFRKALNGSVPVILLLGWGIIAYIILVIVIDLPDGIIIAITAAICIASGIAAQDVLKNVFGGITILFENTFQKGDMIKFGEYHGEVKKISLRATQLLTEDAKIVTIPNSEILNKAVSNSNSGESNCQVVAEIYLPVDVNTTRAREIAIEAAKVSRYIYLNKPITVLFINEVKGRKSFLNMKLNAYVMDLQYESFLRSEMTEIVIRELLREGLISKDATV